MMVKSIGLLVIAALPALAQENTFPAERIREHTKFLSSDLMEGRGVGQRGGQLATEYIATQFALAGAKPAGDNGTYFQRVPLVGVRTDPSATLSATVGGKGLDLKWGDDFVGSSGIQQPDTRFEAGAVFVGHGITAPEFQWDDFKGVNVTGKVLVLFTNEPPSDNPKFFDGPALTYYGRWTYKYEEALRRGARGAIIIHTTPTASYGWDVVRSSWSKEELEMKLAPGTPAVGFAGWITKEAGERIAATQNTTADQWLKLADKRGFKAQVLPLRFRIHASAKIREMRTRNVIGKVEGSDPQLKNEAVMFSAHWDHLGV